ncbi:hypothetical protein V2J09_017334 [Rumex salicifolius]
MENRHHWRPIRNGDFLESEVWDVMEESRVANEPEPTSIGLLSKQLQSSARLIPMAKNQTHEPKLVQHSAPVNIPNWSKFSHGNSSKNSSFADQDWLDEDGDEFKRNKFLNCSMSNGDGDYDQNFRLPPHEWLARKEKRSQMSSFSVCEGFGRTLKGRDQRKVRHAVLTKTGFI